jgi:hypothetical protein
MRKGKADNSGFAMASIPAAARAWQLGNVHRDKECLVAREPFGRQPPLGFILKINIVSANPRLPF